MLVLAPTWFGEALYSYENHYQHRRAGHKVGSQRGGRFDNTIVRERGTLVMANLRTASFSFCSGVILSRCIGVPNGNA